MKAACAGLLLVAAGYGWIAIESRYPIVFRLLDRYERNARASENDRSVEKGLRDIEKRTGVKQNRANAEPLDF